MLGTEYVECRDYHRYTARTTIQRVDSQALDHNESKMLATPRSGDEPNPLKRRRVHMLWLLAEKCSALIASPQADHRKSLLPDLVRSAPHAAS
jgi:hypothetical protein